MRFLLSATSSRPALGHTQPPIQWVPGALTTGLKWPGRETDHSPPSSESMNMYLHSAILLHGVVHS
jgi:hypothetical protein